MSRRTSPLPFGPEQMGKLTVVADDLALFAEVVDAGGFSAASLRTGVTKSRLSRRISELEAILGATLILRNSRHFEVTESGRQVYQHGSAIRAEMHAAMVAIHGNASEPHGVLRIASPMALTSSIVGHVAAEFARTYPQVRIFLSTTKGPVESSTEIFDLILLPSTQALPDSDMVAHRLATVPYCLVAAPAVVEAAGNPADPDALDGMDGIGWGSLNHSSQWHLIGPHGTEADIDVHIRFSSDNLEAIREAALSGLGIARLPRALCNADLEQGRLCLVAQDWRPPSIPIYALYASRRHISVASKFFLAALTKAIDERMIGPHSEADAEAV